MDRHTDVTLTGICEDGKIAFPPIDIEDGEYGFFPYLLKLGNACLRTALATPLCRLRTKAGDTWVFYGDYEPKTPTPGAGGSEGESAGCLALSDGADASVGVEDGVFIWEGEARADILKLSRKEALLAQKLSLDQDYLVLAEDFVWEEEGTVRVTGGADTVIRAFPRLPEERLPGFVECGQAGRFTVYERKVGGKASGVAVSLISRDAEKARYEVTVSYEGERCRMKGRDTFLKIFYSGDRMEIYDRTDKINDHFYTGQEVPLSLGYFGFPERLEIVVYPLEEDAAVFLEKWPEMEDGCACRLDGVAVMEQYW